MVSVRSWVWYHALTVIPDSGVKKRPFSVQCWLRVTCKSLSAPCTVPKPKCSTFFNFWLQNMLLYNLIPEIYTRFPQDSFFRANWLIGRCSVSERCEWRFNRGAGPIGITPEQSWSILCIHSPSFVNCMKSRVWFSWIHDQHPWYHGMMPASWILIMDPWKSYGGYDVTHHGWIMAQIHDITLCADLWWS